MARRAQLKDVSDVFDHGLDLDNRTLFITSAGADPDGNQIGVNWQLADKVVKGLHLLEAAAPNGDKPINIYLNNPGGALVDGMAIYDAIRQCNNRVIVTVMGEACSMGCVILQAADHRVMSPNSILMFHEGQDGYGVNHPEIIRRWAKFNERFSKRVDAILLERIRQKHPEYTAKKFKDMNRFDSIFFAEEAVDLGLADEVLQCL